MRRSLSDGQKLWSQVEMTKTCLNSKCHKMWPCQITQSMTNITSLVHDHLVSLNAFKDHLALICTIVTD